MRIRATARQPKTDGGVLVNEQKLVSLHAYDEREGINAIRTLSVFAFHLSSAGGSVRVAKMHLKRVSSTAGVGVAAGEMTQRTFKLQVVGYVYVIQRTVCP